MTNNEQSSIALQKRVAEYIAAVLRKEQSNVPPLLRVRTAYAAAKTIVERAAANGTLASLEYRLSIAEAGDFQI